LATAGVGLVFVGVVVIGQQEAYLAIIFTGFAITLIALVILREIFFPLDEASDMEVEEQRLTMAVRDLSLASRNRMMLELIGQPSSDHIRSSLVEISTSTTTIASRRAANKFRRASPVPANANPLVTDTDKDRSSNRSSQSRRSNEYRFSRDGPNYDNTHGSNQQQIVSALANSTRALVTSLFNWGSLRGNDIESSSAEGERQAISGNLPTSPSDATSVIEATSSQPSAHQSLPLSQAQTPPQPTVTTTTNNTTD
jgi:hypothetical protein